MLSQPRVTVSDVIPAPIDEVWAAIRGFDQIDEWHPVITGCTIEDGMAPDQVGAVRSFQAGEKSLREKLLAHSDIEHYYQYTILDGAGPKEDYLSEMRAIPVTETGETLIVWTGTFDADPGAMDDEVEGTTKVYTAGLGGLAEQFE